MYGETRRSPGGGLRQVIALLTLAFLVTLGVVIGTRMSSDAIAVLVGVIAGVAASIPTALLLMAVTRRREPELVHERDPVHRAGPPVIVVAPGASPQQQLPAYLPYGMSEMTAPKKRQFRVMGYEDGELEPVEGAGQEAGWR